MSSKNSILKAIRDNNIVKDMPLPEYENFGITFDNKFEKFSEVLRTVGGEAIVTSKEKLDNVIKEIYKKEKIIYSNVEYCELGNFEANEKALANDLKNIDLAIVEGNFAIAENGAVWIKNSSNRHRSLYFIAQNIVIVLKKDQILNNMHEAYEKIDFENRGWGAFVSGPSKTADIEQSLVIGAHGPKSGYVIFVE